MNEQREVVILSGVRTAIGDYGGSLKDLPPTELAARVVRMERQLMIARLQRAGLQVVEWNVAQPFDQAMRRAAAVRRLGGHR